MYQSKYKAVKYRKNILFLVLMVLVIGLSIASGVEFNKKAGLVKLLLGLIGIGIIFLLVDYRCPKCSSFLGKNLSNNYCSQCGTKLQ